MCGITGYIGRKEGLPIVFANLRKLEYRGYDSAGVAFFGESGIKNRELRIKNIKAVGKLVNLEKAIAKEKSLPLTAAIAHTRWATHGIPNQNNAHPHYDCDKEIFLVHNGIVENYREIRGELAKKGHHFRSQTDTEVIAHLIEEYLKYNPNYPKKYPNDTNAFSAAFEGALKKIVGAYALAVVFKNEPEKLYVARLGSPLVVGVGDDEYFVASDPAALAGLVKKVIYLKDGQRGILGVDGFKIGPAKLKIETLDLDPEQARKGKFPHFMAKEIFEGPEVVGAALRGRLFPEKNFVKLGGLESVLEKLKEIKRIELIACGTSYYAGLVGSRLFKEISGLPSETLLASEYRYENQPVQKGTAAIFISQSGETADTLAALRKAKSKRNLTLGIVNAVGSSIARETTAGVYNHAGPEIGVASTKAFLSQLAVLNLMAMYLSPGKNKKIMAELAAIPEKIRKTFKQANQIKKIAKKYSPYQNFLYLGRGYNYPTALEGALKLKEISYVHAEGYAGGEMKHGPIALIDGNFPTVAIATQNSVYEKMLSNLEEIKARGGPILAVASVGDKKISKIADDVIYVPKTLEHLEPMVNIAPLQLFAYYTGVLKGYDVDKPRNLAKSVTVE